MKKVGKTTRPFRYDLSQIPYDYTVEVTNSFKGLNLIDRVPEELWMEVCDIVHKLATLVVAWVGGEFGGEWIHVYVWLSPFAFHLKPSQHCLLIGYTPTQKDKKNKLAILFLLG